MSKMSVPLVGLITEIYGDENAVTSDGIVVKIDGELYYTEKKKWDIINVTPLKPYDAEYIHFLDEPISIDEGDLVWTFGEDYVEVLGELAQYSSPIDNAYKHLITLPEYHGSRIIVGNQNDFTIFAQKISDEMEPILKHLITTGANLENFNNVRMILVGTLGSPELATNILLGVISIVKEDQYGYNFKKIESAHTHPELNFDKEVKNKLDELQQKDM